MTDEQQKPEEESPVEAVAEVEPPATMEDEYEDIRPITMDAVASRIIDVGRTTKNGFLKPVYEIGWRWLDGASNAANQFLDEALGGNKRRKK